MSSSRGKKQTGFLGSQQIERLLNDWANLPSPDTQHGADATARLVRRYPEIFPAPIQVREKEVNYASDIALTVLHYLKKAWREPERRRREWYIFKLRDNYAFHAVRIPEQLKYVMEHEENSHLTDLVALNEPPPLTQFEQIMDYFHSNSDRARFCLNRECPAPYFFAPEKKKGQRYCSLKCSAAGIREKKRNWWNENRAKPKKRGGN